MLTTPLFSIQYIFFSFLSVEAEEGNGLLGICDNEANNHRPNLFEELVNDDGDDFVFYTAENEETAGDYENDFDDASSLSSSFYSFGADFDFDEEEDEFEDCLILSDDTVEEEERQDRFLDRLINMIQQDPGSYTMTGITNFLRLFHYKDLPKNFDFLPKTYKGLLHTPRKAVMTEMKPGKYIHFGFLHGIISSLDSLNLPIDFNEIKV